MKHNMVEDKLTISDDLNLNYKQSLPERYFVGFAESLRNKGFAVAFGLTTALNLYSAQDSIKEYMSTNDSIIAVFATANLIGAAVCAYLTSKTIRDYLRERADKTKPRQTDNML